MSDYDQHGNHFPDHNHLQHFPSDAYGDDAPTSSGAAFPWPRIRVGTASLAVVIALVIIVAVLVSYGRTPQSAAQERAVQADTKARMARILEELRQRRKGETR